jgi:hypothetical protein
MGEAKRRREAGMTFEYSKPADMPDSAKAGVAVACHLFDVVRRDHLRLDKPPGVVAIGETAATSALMALREFWGDAFLAKFLKNYAHGLRTCRDQFPVAVADSPSAKDYERAVLMLEAGLKPFDCTAATSEGLLNFGLNILAKTRGTDFMAETLDHMADHTAAGGGTAH